MSNVSQSSGASAAAAPQPTPPAPQSPLRTPERSPRQRGSLWARLLATVKYLTHTEVHTFAFSVAANAVLSFFPFLVLMLSLTRRTLHSPTMTAAFLQMLRDYLPTGQDFVIRNLNALVSAHRGVKVFSLVMLLFTSSGVFLPLEVALNHVWGFPKNRSYVNNQLISLVLAFACGSLAMLSVAATAGNRWLLHLVFGDADWMLVRVLAFIIMKSFALVASIGIFFITYWLLPAGKVPVFSVLRVSVVIGILWEISKYGYILALPFLDFQQAYGPFAISVTLIFWAFLSGLLMLAGAQLCAGAAGADPRSSAA